MFVQDLIQTTNWSCLWVASDLHRRAQVTPASLGGNQIWRCPWLVSYLDPWKATLVGFHRLCQPKEVPAVEALHLSL